MSHEQKPPELLIFRWEKAKTKQVRMRLKFFFVSYMKIVIWKTAHRIRNQPCSISSLTHRCDCRKKWAWVALMMWVLGAACASIPLEVTCKTWKSYFSFFLRNFRFCCCCFGGFCSWTKSHNIKFIHLFCWMHSCIWGHMYELMRWCKWKRKKTVQLLLLGYCYWDQDDYEK